MLSSKNELKLIHIGGSFCSASISISVSASKQSKYSGLKEAFANVPMTRRWNCKWAILEVWDEPSYFVSISKISVSRKIVFRRFQWSFPFSNPSVDWTSLFEWNRFISESSLSILTNPNTRKYFRDRFRLSIPFVENWNLSARARYLYGQNFGGNLARCPKKFDFKYFNTFEISALNDELNLPAREFF